MCRFILIFIIKKDAKTPKSDCGVTLVGLNGKSLKYKILQSL